MYTMVLMAALSGGAGAPAGAWGGYGWGMGPSSYPGYGYGCCGCYGGYGAYGGYTSGWYGWGYGNWGYGGWGGWGERTGYWAGFPYGTGWGWANATPTLIPIPGPPPAVAVANRGAATDTRVVAASGQPKAGTTGSNRAALVVHLPAGAKLTVDDTPTRGTSDTRRFVTPPLEPGQRYVYVLKGELDRNGEKVRASQNVEVRAGRTSEVYLDFPGQQRAGR